MLYQDSQTGMLHEAPDSQVYGWGLAEDPYGVGEGQVVYDGLGNPLGWGFLKKLVKKAAPFATSMLGPYGQIIKHALPVVTRALGPTAQAMRQQAIQQLSSRQPVPVQPQPQLEGVAVGLSRPGVYSRIPVSPVPVRPLPAGWRRPQGPNTGVPPRRLYMRCSVWPGPRGLVPVNVAQGPVITPPVPGMVAPQTAAPRGVMRRRVRGRRR